MSSFGENYKKNDLLDDIQHYFSEGGTIEEMFDVLRYIFEYGKTPLDDLIQENQKYKEVIDNLKDKLMEYFEVGRDSYFYVLTRDKSAFDYGTMSFDDFIEFSEEQVDDIVDFLKEVEHE